MANFANAITFRVTISTVYLAPDPITAHANAENVSVKLVGRDLIVLVEIQSTPAFHHVCFYYTYVLININNNSKIAYIFSGGGEICSGKGECVCGECQCIEEDGGRYSGKHCEECPVCI